MNNTRTSPERTETINALHKASGDLHYAQHSLRNAAIWAYTDRAMTVSDIATTLGMTRQTIYRWLEYAGVHYGDAN